MAGRRNFHFLTITSSPASKVMPTRYNKYTLDNNNTQPICNNYSQDNLILAIYTRESYKFSTCLKIKNPQSEQSYV